MMNLLKQMKTLVSAIALLAVSFTAHAQITNDITHDEAFKALLAAKKNAEDSNVLVNIADTVIKDQRKIPVPSTLVLFI